MSDDPSTRDRRITKTCFRTCLSRRTRSQAPFCLCTLRLVSNQSEGTFAHLRYHFGGDRPSQTARQTVSSPGLRAKLGSQPDQGGISRTTRPRLAPRLQRLPPILHKSDRDPLSSYSKGSRGLSVWSRVIGICTDIPISLSPSRRQWGSRYTIRAGRNLPDKEFRYLRTVIVTAAVYWGFNSQLRLR